MSFEEFYQKGMELLLTEYINGDKQDIRAFYEEHKDWVEETYNETITAKRYGDADPYLRKLKALCTSLAFDY